MIAAETKKNQEMKYDRFMKKSTLVGWHQEPNHAQCPKCKNYTWYTDGNGNFKCTSCGFSYGK